jgi:hypothetical protein
MNTSASDPPRDGIRSARAYIFRTCESLAGSAHALPDEAAVAVAGLLAIVAAVAETPEPAPRTPAREQAERPRFLTAGDVAKLFKIDKSTVYKRARFDPGWRAAVVRLGPGTLRFDGAKLERLISTRSAN